MITMMNNIVIDHLHQSSIILTHHHCRHQHHHSISSSSPSRLLLPCAQKTIYMEIDIVLQVHGKLANSRADAFKRFMSDLRAAATTPLPQWTMMQEIAADIADADEVMKEALVEHNITESVVRQKGFEVGCLLKRNNDTTKKCTRLWRITTIEHEKVCMTGEHDNAGKTLEVNLEKFVQSFVQTEELPDQVLMMSC